jgi:hypothetical protein
MSSSIISSLLKQQPNPQSYLQPNVVETKLGRFGKCFLLQHSQDDPYLCCYDEVDKLPFFIVFSEQYQIGLLAKLNAHLGWLSGGSPTCHGDKVHQHRSSQIPGRGSNGHYVPLLANIFKGYKKFDPKS